MSYPRENTRQFSSDPALAANADAVATFDASGVAHRWRIKYVIASYNGTPTAGKQLVITDHATETNPFTFTVPVLTSAPLILPLLDLQTGPNCAPTVTLLAGGAGVIGFVNVIGVFE